MAGHRFTVLLGFLLQCVNGWCASAPLKVYNRRMAGTVVCTSGLVVPWIGSHEAVSCCCLRSLHAMHWM
jgi:hypothetical protein